MKIKVTRANHESTDITVSAEEGLRLFDSFVNKWWGIPVDRKATPLAVVTLCLDNGDFACREIL